MSDLSCHGYSNRDLVLSLAVRLLSELIAYPTVSHTSNQAITEWVADRLRAQGFECEQTRYLDGEGVPKFNLIAKRLPTDSSSKSGDLSTQSIDRPENETGLAYFCHTDVVPADRWGGPGGNPFEAVIEDNRLYGRGSCDMKGSLAAMLAAIDDLDASKQSAPLWVVCTADEEVGLRGAKELAQSSPAYRELVALDPVALIGEPTELGVVHAHKGMGGFRVISHGKAAHSSTNRGVNANVAMIPLLQTILELHERSQTDPMLRDDRFDPPTLTFNFGISDHADATNIVPDRSEVWANWRAMPSVDGECLMAEAKAAAEQLGLQFRSYKSVAPLETPIDDPTLVRMCELASSYCGREKAETVCYATDGAVLEELRHRIVCGPGSIEQAHTVDEFIELESLENGVSLFREAVQAFAMKA
ncbi:M20 family metallopeptidase [Rhodopirellula bahusiensis]|uniref:Acetylornithine deacetylase n=2 Tax=Rhodopirellula bahusiensis TaxID=2014065 RepID=A0A2G1WDX9_9BACT|nr:M20 family metallopeptidase [Rhodopirellula bahusiensis]PHQ37227.1 acetylornithine deacetylase [Rhodopirellula bahusiensis]